MAVKFASDFSTLLADLDCFDLALDQRISSIRDDQHSQRIQNWQSQLRSDFKQGGRKAYAWLKDDWQPPITAIQSDDGSIAVTPGQVFDCLQDSWNQLFNQNNRPSWDLFQQHFGQFLLPHHCDIPRLSADLLHNHIQTMSNHRAVAVDGWRIHEMKQLPLPILELAADLLNNIEEGQPWPKLNCFACVSCLPKIDLDVSKPDLAPGPLIPKAFDTRPISNISPWTTLYSGIRFKQMSAWREEWLPASMHGARRLHEPNDVAFELQLLLEHSKLKGDHVAGISLDRNFFDLLPHQLCFNILTSLGAPQQVIRAETSFYQHFECLYKANGAFSSQTSTRINGFIQGCSFSLQASLALLSIWTKSIESCESSEATISTGCFLDDNNFRTISDSAESAANLLEEAWNRSLEFDKLAGMQLNNAKSVCFGNTQPVRKYVGNKFAVEPHGLKLVNSFLSVGGMITVHGQPVVDHRKKKIAKALVRLKRGRYSPLPFDQRVLMTQTAIMPIALYGSELVPLTINEMESLRRRVTSCLYKGHYWCCSPSANFTFVLPGHLLDAVQASIYHCVQVVRRILRRRLDLMPMYQDVHKYYDQGSTSSGPVNNLRQVVKSCGCVWDSPTRI